MDRNQKFGRLLAIANVLAERVYEKGKPLPSHQFTDRFSRKPMDTFVKIHEDLMQYTHKFGGEEMHLVDMFGEILAGMEVEEFSNDALKPSFLQAFCSQQHALHNVIGVEEAAELWGLSAGTIKNYCAQGKIQSRKIGKTWVIDKNQPNPGQGI